MLSFRMLVYMLGIDLQGWIQDFPKGGAKHSNRSLKQGFWVWGTAPRSYWVLFLKC